MKDLVSHCQSVLIDGHDINLMTPANTAHGLPGKRHAGERIPKMRGMLGPNLSPSPVRRSASRHAPGRSNGDFDPPTRNRTLIGAKIAVSSDGTGHIFDFQKCDLIGPSGQPTDLKVVFSHVRELEMRLRHVTSAEQMMEILQRHAHRKNQIEPLYLEA